MIPFVVITPGDLDGIGLEITAKSLVHKKISNKYIILVIVHPSQMKTNEFNLLKTVSKEVHSIAELTNLRAGFYYLLDPEQPPFWVEKYAHWVSKQNGNAALVTGPLSKSLIRKCGFQSIGHTEILADVSKTPLVDLFMFFIGNSFNAVSLTGHIPLAQVEKTLMEMNLKSTLTQLLNWLKKTPLNLDSLFMLGLNPHNGEGGLIGRFETDHLIPMLQTFNQNSLKGPLVPDAAFNPKNLVKHATYIGLYHDQVLIPFKQAHSFSGVHITAGLPFLRTSVDHGTAKDIYGQNKAEINSMLDAINLAESWLPFYYYDPARRS